MNIHLKLNIRRILLFFMLTFALVCKTNKDKYFWYSPREVISNVDKLQPGDILILSKKPTLRSMWGHAAVLNEHKKVVEFPSYSAGYSESPLYVWQTLNRKITIFRLKGIDDKFKIFKITKKTVL